MPVEMYLSQCSFEGDGKILNEEDEVVWQLTTRHGRAYPIWSVTYGLFRDLGASIAQVGSDEILLVNRERQLPLPRFIMTRNGEHICTIMQRSLCLNSYSLAFANGENWNFHMPLFTVYFQGCCDGEGIVQVREWAKRQWVIRIESEHPQPLLLCALAFIHRERLRFA
ncbi:hypothetical protein EON83_27595 [bacterium]|nr:MAG: hypothetical protein EON83_27595 [bacterium]